MKLTRRAVVLGLTSAFLFAGCNDGIDGRIKQAGERLAIELPARFPAEILAVGFEYQPPLDPPALFVDLTPSMSPGAQLRFLCDSIMPLVSAASHEIHVTVSYGWWDADCSAP